MNLLTVENITKAYTERKLFNGASFYLHEGDKVGVIGINGTGKSTLLKFMAGLESPDKGSIIKANHVVIRFLSQHPVFDHNHSVLESVLDGNRTKGNEWTIENDAKTMLTRLGVTNFHQPTNQLSGGQKKRLALVSTLLAPADILIMDEPTNHLDSDMADWLEDYLKRWRGAIVMVTHDRYFLDSISNRIIEIDKGQIYSYETNYSGFLQLKAEREDMTLASERKRQSILRVELEWMQRGPRARSTKQKARIERYEDLKEQNGPATDGKVELSSISTRLGRTTIELDSINKAYGDKILIKDFSYIFLNNDRVGFIGCNGCGKTTLMKIIAGKIQADSGNLMVGQTVKIGYYTQEIATSKEEGISYMNPEDKVIDYIRNTAEFVQTKEGSISASQMLERFLFPASAQYSRIGKLSGGEKRRLNLLRVLMEAPNVLILDEPTNDLDIATLTILEDYIDRFDGIVICVSHDRFFLDRIINRIFAFEEDGNMRQYEGGYTDFVNKKAEREIESQGLIKEKEKKGIYKNSNSQKSEGCETQIATEEIVINDGRVRERKLKFSFQEQKDYETIEDDIAKIELKLEDLGKKTTQFSSDFIKLNEIALEKENTEGILEEKMQRWMYLEELAVRISEN